MITAVFQANSLPLLNNFFEKKITKNNPSLHIGNITPKDDAFHGSTPFPSCEWWYFDGMFSQNYSVHVGYRILTFRGLNFLKPSINIYQDEEVIANETIILPSSSFEVSSTYPKLMVHNENIMTFDFFQYNRTGDWIYHINYSLNDIGIDLKFSSETKGWNYKTAHEGWTVAIPQGTVEGYLYLLDQKIAVEGRGYHDHNWNFSIQTPARGWSWYWGKITGQTLNLAWAEIKETGLLEQTFSEKLAVLNTQQDEFIVINPDNITFSVEKFIFKDNRFIPTVFHITIQQEDIQVDVTLTAKTIHRSDPTMMTIHYWRYFATVNGIISYDNIAEHIENKIQIMEYMRFI